MYLCIYVSITQFQAGNYFCLVDTGYDHNEAAQLVHFGPEVRNSNIHPHTWSFQRHRPSACVFTPSCTLTPRINIIICAKGAWAGQALLLPAHVQPLEMLCSHSLLRLQKATVRSTPGQGENKPPLKPLLELCFAQLSQRLQHLHWQATSTWKTNH